MSPQIIQPSRDLRMIVARHNAINRQRLLVIADGFLVLAQIIPRRRYIIQPNRDVRMVVAIHGTINRQRLLNMRNGFSMFSY